MRMRVLVTLNSVCIVVTLYNRDILMVSEFALSVRSVVFGSGRPVEEIMNPMKFRNSGNMASTHNTPKTLKTVWAMAARLAVVFPTDAAIFAAIVVPMFSPRIIAAASLNGITPVVIRSMIIAMVAAEDWKQTVITVPIKRKRRTETLTGPRWRFVNA